MNAAPATPWVDPVAAWPDRRGHRFLRAYSDAVNTALLERWLPDRPVRAVLKTDLFDEAVGDGLYPLLSRRAERVTAVDVSPATLTAALTRYPDLDAMRADVRALPHPDACFDVVVSNSTLDHLPTLAEVRVALAELHRVLEPEGILILTLDNGANPIVALRNALPFPLLRRLRLVQHPPGVSCGPRDLRTLVEEAGFRVDRHGALMHVPRVLALAAGALVPAASLLRLLARVDSLSRLPTRSLTAQFVAVRAVRL